MSYQQELREAVIARRQRLWGSAPVAPRPARVPTKVITVRKIAEPIIEEVQAEPSRHPYGAPLNMLSPCSPRFLIAYCALKHALPIREVMGRGQTKAVVAARFEAMGLMYQHTQASLPKVGAMFGRDHTTVLASLRKIGRTRKLVEKAGQAVRFERPQQDGVADHG